MEPVVINVNPYTPDFDTDFELSYGKDADNKQKGKLLTQYPTVYIHNWQPDEDYEVYVGETNNILQRTKQHKDASSDSSSWQYRSKKFGDRLYIIGHEHFNKSLTLDIENRLIEYMTSIYGVKRVNNSRANPQIDYYSHDELDSIFTSIWSKLVDDNPNLFPSEEKIKESAIFKASPLKKLTEDQQKVQDLIIDKVIELYKKESKHKLIFVDGEAGTGKTVLNSSTFYKLFCLSQDEDSLIHKANEPFRSCLIVNHIQQKTVYTEITKKLGMADHGDVVFKPTEFINRYDTENPIDVAFVDEGHLLLTQKTQGYSKEEYSNVQLEEIMKRAKITVVMFDERQILKGQQYWENKLLNKFRDMAKENNCYIQLTQQLRMKTDPISKDWIDSFTNRGILKTIPKSSTYEIKIFDNPYSLDKAIEDKAKGSESSLSRLVATYDWDYKSGEKDSNKEWDVVIGDWHKPWNYELERKMHADEKRKIKDLAWAEQPQTIMEVGSTYSIQGFDLNYVGVILGPSVKYRNGKVIFDHTSTSNKAVTKRTISNGQMIDCRDELLEHEIRVLMTRGVDGLYIYACDKELREALLKAQG